MVGLTTGGLRATKFAEKLQPSEWNIRQKSKILASFCGFSQYKLLKICQTSEWNIRQKVRFWQVFEVSPG